jgi:hypothetical protein
MAASVLTAFAVTACGGSGHPAATPQTTAAATTAPATTSTAPAVPAPAPHIRIIAPRSGAATAQTLTVRLSLSGGAGIPHTFRYVLDGTDVRLGSARLTFHGLAFGRHHLTVMLASRHSVKATRSFVVPTPTPAAAPTSTQASAPAAPTPTTASAPATSPAPAATPAPAPTPAPSTSGNIPQGPSAGDADSDNHGAPSDGDGNI